MPDQSDHQRYLNAAWWIAVASALGLAAFLVLAPFGFDHRSSWGLDIEHAAMASLALACATLAAVGIAIYERSPARIALAILAPGLGLLLGLLLSMLAKELWRVLVMS